MRRFALRAWLLATTLTLSVCAQAPEWIWGATATDNETRVFRRQFDAPEGVTRALLLVVADNSAEVRIDGRVVGRNSDWSNPSLLRLNPRPAAGPHLLEVTAHNADSAAGLLLALDLSAPGKSVRIVTDAHWETSAAGAGAWTAATSLGRVGVQPWGDVLKAPSATPADSIQVAPGFKVEMLRSAESGEGSWVSMTLDPQGRLILSPQGSEPLLRVTLDPAGKVASVAPLSVGVTGAMGMLYAYDSLYINGVGPQGYHLYRLRDTDGQGHFAHLELLRRWQSGGGGDGNGEHGAHAIVQGPDGKLYIVCGNFIDLPNDLAPTSKVRHYADDTVLPRMEDGNGFGAGRKPPGGFVLRVDRDGGNAEVLAAGERNTYDIAFNAAGELFGFDSDMEWDWGAPWYRPIRIYHIVSGGDQGFREGSAKWPEYYQDSLPAVVNVGIGSPTGVRFGTGARFPARYQRALFAMDWSYGRILAVHLAPEGASYRGDFETFIRGKPLNVTDFEIGRDGALYFITGGRGTQSGLYRVSYVGSEDTAPAPREDLSETLIPLRREIEGYQGRPLNPGESAPASGFSGDYPGVFRALASTDRHLRYAARLVLESQPIGEWRGRALAETNANAGLTAALAIARVGRQEDNLAMLQTLTRWPLTSLDTATELLELRVIEVSFARQGIPDAMRAWAIETLDSVFPAGDFAVNRELSQLLIALDAPDAVHKTLALRDAARTQEEQLHYQAALRRAKSGWTAEDRKRYFAWFYTRPSQKDAGATYPRGGSYAVSSADHPAAFKQWFRDVGLEAGNGASFNNFIAHLKSEAISGLADNEKGELAPWITGAAFKLAPATAAPKAARTFVKDWKFADLESSLPEIARGRDYERGKSAFTDAQCAACHRFNGEGGAVGPDLTGVGSRYSLRDILNSIVDPSAVINEQYQALTFTLKGGDEITGRLLEDNPSTLIVLIDPLAGKRTEINKSEVISRVASKVSPMPEGLISVFRREEILDLIAFLVSDGSAAAANFRK